MTREEFIYKYDGCIIESLNPASLSASEFLKAVKTIQNDAKDFQSIVEKEGWHCEDTSIAKFPVKFYFSVMKISNSDKNLAKSKSLTDFLADYVDYNNNNLIKKEEEKIEEEVDIVKIENSTEKTEKAAKKKKYKIKCIMEIEVEEITD